MRDFQTIETSNKSPISLRPSKENSYEKIVEQSEETKDLVTDSDMKGTSNEETSVSTVKVTEKKPNHGLELGKFIQTYQDNVHNS